MTSNAATGIARCADSLRVAVESVFSSLSVLDAQAQALLSAASAHGVQPSSEDLVPLRPVIESVLAAQEGRFNGTGVVMAPDALSDARLHLEWWQRAGGKGFRPLHLDLNPRSENYYDYTLKRWFAIPRDEGHGTVMGPYVDLHGADLYLLTFALPLVVEGRFVGVVGADVPVSGFEQLVVPALKQLGCDAVVITGEGRVLAANTPVWAVGALARDLLPEDVGVERARVRTPEVDWSVVRVDAPH
ncbi:cache domain-containing protein [Streptomyces sp. NPDC048385]|uniref:cache domain-containing protein n=1 Tax=Streptomyces sp. NPDC048385 TaxID=3155145 RepID=UPI003449B013